MINIIFFFGGGEVYFSEVWDFKRIWGGGGGGEKKGGGGGKSRQCIYARLPF